MPRVICKSGLRGYRCRLQQSYSSFEEFEAYSETYGLHRRLRYLSARDAWDDNPMIEGSIEPSDFRKVCRSV